MAEIEQAKKKQQEAEDAVEISRQKIQEMETEA